MSAPFVWWSAGSSRRRRKISGTSLVPRTSWPSARYSPASFSIWLEADLVDLLGRAVERRVVADHPVVGVVAVGQPRQPDVVVVAGVGPDLGRGSCRGSAAIAGRTSFSMTSRRRARQASASATPVGSAVCEERVVADRRRRASDRSGRRCRRTAKAAGVRFAGDALEQPIAHVAEVAWRSPRVFAIIASATSAFGIGSFG